MFISKNTQKTPTIWDLSDLMPELQPQLVELRHAVERYNPQKQRSVTRFDTAVSALREAYDARVDDFIYVAGEQKSRVDAQNDAPDADALRQVYDEYFTMMHEFTRVGHFSRLLGDEYYKVPAIREFSEHAQERHNQVYRAFDEIWQDIALDADAIEQVTAQHPHRKYFGSLLAPKAPPAPYVPIEEQRAQREAQDVRLADYRHLYSELASSTDMPLNEQAAITAKMFSALTFQQSTEAAQQGHTTASRYAEKESLPADFMDGYLATLPAFKENFAQSKSAETPLPPPQYSWKEATDIVVAAFEKFHPEMGELARDAIADEWVHASPNPQKFHNGYAMGHLKSSIHPANHPYILMHFDGSPDSLETLGHELGHAIVQQLEGEEQYRTLPAGALHETFAHFAAGLTMEEAASRAKTPQECIGIMQHLRDSTFNTIQSQTTLADFESRLYNMAAGQNLESLTQEQIFDAIVQSGLAHPIPEGASPEQAQIYQQQNISRIGKSIMHYTNQTPHYVTNYVLAEAGAQTLLEQHRNLPEAERKAFADKWVETMRDAPSYNYGKAMQHMDIPVEGSALLQPAARRIQQLSGEIQAAQQSLQVPTPHQNFAERFGQNNELKHAISGLTQQLQTPKQNGNNLSHTQRLQEQRRNHNTGMQR